ncbi:MAG TPA: DUF5916 domain-containing protein, partial [Gemmatimonadales bacterium]|nr:DUF5916 domain-containing protein [Gemmatimonadales bacterium]
MSLALLLALQAAAAVVTTGPGPTVFNGRAGQTSLKPPRIDTTATLDGRLDEPAWREAAVLTGFSEFLPVDDVPASDSTTVLVWYSPTALHIGVRAWEPHGEPHATLADRDQIASDDWIELLIGTFNDGRTATMFGVNPLGVQADGALVETGQNSTQFGSSGASRDRADLSPDYTWHSLGRLVPGGYEVEIEIPFKSLRFQPEASQAWSFQVVRHVQHSGYEDVWAPARRASSSFIGQSGHLTDLEGLKRGLVLDVNPELTAGYAGARTPSGAYEYGDVEPHFGGSLRWGVSNNLTLNAAANPDFSQVESDAGQISFDPRQALFFAEKRPFFLDGIEQFNTPNNLIYTRRIVQPVAAAKLTGKTLGADVALLSAIDDADASATGHHPVFNILRAQKGIGGGSRIGMAYTDQIDGGDYNRVADVDGRFVFGGVYAVVAQLAGSRTRTSDVTTTAPLWNLRFDRNGQRFGWRTTFTGIGDEFITRSGFIPRNGVVHATITPNYSFYPKAGSLVQRVTTAVTLDGIWQYQHFIHDGQIQDRKLHFDVNSLLRGGWTVGAGWFVESFGYDEGLFSNYFLGVPDGSGGISYQPYVGQPRIDNNEFYVSLGTPVFQRFDANIFSLYGHDENFPEWASADLLIIQGGINARPTDQLRLSFTYNHQQVNRRTDGSLVLLNRIPRLKMEYQLAR